MSFLPLGIDHALCAATLLGCCCPGPVGDHVGDLGGSATPQATQVDMKTDEVCWRFKPKLVTVSADRILFLV